MLISIWNGKINLIKKKRRQVVEVVICLFLWVNFGRVFPLNDGGIYMATWVWNAKYLFWVEEWEQLYFKKTMESMCFGFYYLDVPTFCWLLLEAVPDVNATSSMKKLVFCGDNALHVGKRRRFSWSPRLTVVPVGDASKAFIHVWKIQVEINGWHLCVGELVGAVFGGLPNGLKKTPGCLGAVICGLCK